MKDIFLSFLVLFILQIESCTSQNRYCQEAVNSVEIVESCPSSKAEWDDAARRKDCGRLASKQNCTTAEKFLYHCVINGLGNKLLEVCGPRRIIFGHCVEFNVLGGVIQDQHSAPCNATFPKCDDHYYSSDAYKYPDCYELVSNSDSIHVSRTTAAESTHTDISISTATGPTPTDEPSSLPGIIILFCIPLYIGAVLYFVWFRSKRGKSTHIKSEKKTKSNRQIIKVKTTESSRVMQNPLKQNHKEYASKANFDDLGVLQPDSNHKEDASKAKFDDLGVLQPDSNSLCNSEVSTGINSVAPSSSGSSYYDDPENRELLTSSPVKEYVHISTETYL